jgi:hypothetical protein
MRLFIYHKMDLSRAIPNSHHGRSTPLAR